MSYSMDDRNGSEMEFSISGSMDAPTYRDNDGAQDGDGPQAPGMQNAMQQEDDANTNDQASTSEEGRSWIFAYKYGERYMTEQGKERIRCKVGNCTKMYSSIKKTTTTFITHLRNSHGITEFTGPHAHDKKRGGPLDSFLAKRTRTFDQNEFNQQFIKFLVSGKLPFTTSENKHLQRSLEMAQTAPTMAAIKLPNAVTFARKTTMEYHACYDRLRTVLHDLLAISCTLDCWTSPFNQAFLGVTGHWICEKT
ncbi:hypothetical protein O0I10_012979 [Lichtheimia ornata]|uniref:BED-type domain-containing protein n=1 Tax=Lichtheimia ornata TaxID=688661 RepID=A0AAD7USI1_9FUNG|nr:uncharacterized protein O0I10_012979 [Lichtheimia ornata]KAJ8651461.1 hypothetical protein O0I10_012979 [Lichtheimia ornata]